MRRNKYIHHRLLVWGEYMRDGIIPKNPPGFSDPYIQSSAVKFYDLEVDSIILGQIKETLRAVETLSVEQQNLLVIFYIQRRRTQDIMRMKAVGRKTVHRWLCQADIDIQNYFDEQRANKKIIS